LVEDDSRIFGTLFYSDIFKFIEFHLAHLPSQAHLDFELVHLADPENCRIHSEMNKGDWWWDTKEQFPG
jgi:hypothetical protein